MFRIGICDDTECDRELAERVCADHLKNKGIDFEIVSFENGFDFFAYKKEIHLAILDIEMPDMNGIEIKNKMESLDSRTFILYMTNYSHFMQDAFGVNVLGYVFKWDMEKRLLKTIDTVVNKVCKYAIVNGVYDSREILYIKSRRSYCEINFVNGEQKTVPKKPLNEYEKELVEVNFLRVHKSYLVNLRWVTKMSKEQVFFENVTVPIAKRRWAHVKEEWINYDM